MEAAARTAKRGWEERVDRERYHLERRLSASTDNSTRRGGGGGGGDSAFAASIAQKKD